MKLTRNCGTANSHHEHRATEVPGLLAARFGVSNFDGAVRVVVVGASVKLPRIVGVAPGQPGDDPFRVVYQPLIQVVAAVIVAPALWWLYATFQRDRTSEIENPVWGVQSAGLSNQSHQERR